MPVVVVEAQALELAVDLHAQVEHDALPQHLGEPRLPELEEERGDEEGEEGQRNARDAVEIAGGNVAVDGQLGEPRLGELRQRARQDGHEPQRHVQPVRAQVAQQTAHEPPVIGLPENVLLVHRRI